MKTARLGILAVLVSVAFPLSALAASVITAPVHVASRVGSTFTVTLTADPGSAKVYTVSAHVSFDPKLVRLVSFTFAPQWIPLSQAGYDEESNTQGILIKTAGYPGGLTAPTVLGRAIFRAVAAGSSSVTVSTGSLALDGSGKNQISGAQGATAIAVTAVQAPKPSTKPAAKTKLVVETATTTANAAEAVATATATTAPALPAAAAAAPAASGLSAWLWALIAIVVLAIIGGAVAWYRRKVNKLGL